MILVGALISILPNQLKALQGWKRWSLLPMGATQCANHYPAIYIKLYRSTFILDSKVHAGSFHFSVIHWTDNYRIYNVRTWAFLRVHIHTRVGHTDNPAQHFLLRKAHKFFLCSWRDWNLGSLNLESDALPIEPTRRPDSDLEPSKPSMAQGWWWGWPTFPALMLTQGAV